MSGGWQAIAPRSREAVSQGVNLLGSTIVLIHVPDCEPTIRSIPSCKEVILREHYRSADAFLKEERLLRFISLVVRHWLYGLLAASHGKSFASFPLSL